MSNWIVEMKGQDGRWTPMTMTRDMVDQLPQYLADTATPSEYYIPHDYYDDDDDDEKIQWKHEGF